MLVDEEILVWELQDDGEEAKKWNHYIGVQSTREVLDFWEMGLQKWRLSVFTLEVEGELGDVVNLHIIYDASLLSDSVAAPSVVVCCSVVTFIFRFLIHG
jgi:hypothetical protein